MLRVHRHVDGQLVAAAQQPQPHRLPVEFEVDQVLEGEALLLADGERAVVGDRLAVDGEQDVVPLHKVAARALGERQHAADQHARPLAHSQLLAQLWILKRLPGELQEASQAESGEEPGEGSGQESGEVWLTCQKMPREQKPAHSFGRSGLLSSRKWWIVGTGMT